MSLYVEWINQIKMMSDESWLTENQKDVYQAVLTRWQAHPFVNLIGPAGSGKTFIARILAKNHGYVHTHKIEDAPEQSQQVIVDNADYSRSMRLMARVNGLDRVILITQVPIREAMPSVRLELTEKDVQHFIVNLSEHCHIQFTETKPQGVNLAEILRKEVIQRGGTHVH